MKKDEKKDIDEAFRKIVFICYPMIEEGKKITVEKIKKIHTIAKEQLRKIRGK